MIVCNTGLVVRRRRYPVEETLNRILQHQKLTYELLEALYGDEPIREDDTGKWPTIYRDESK